MGALVLAAVVAATAGVARPYVGAHGTRTELLERSRDIATLLHEARRTAEALGVSVVVATDRETVSLYSFVDRNGNLEYDRDEDLLATLRVGDRLAADRVAFVAREARGRGLGSGLQPLDGLTPIDAGARRVAVFERHGSIRQPGAFRISDGEDMPANILEVRIRRGRTPVELAKLVYGSVDEPTRFVPFGLSAWEWY